MTPPTAALPSTISRITPADADRDRRRRPRRMSSSSTPSESSTTPSAGSVSRPVKGGARNAPTEPPTTSSPKTDVAEAVVEQEAEARLGEALEFADQLHQPFEELLLARSGELELAPAPRHPDFVRVRRSAAAASRIARISNTWVTPPVGSGSAGTPSSSTNSSAKLFSSNSSIRPPTRLAAVALQPAFELVADLRRGAASAAARCAGVRRPPGGWRGGRPSAASPRYPRRAMR